MRHTIASLGLLALLLLTGCSTGGDPFSIWQDSLEGFVTQQGNGDLNSLRNVREDPSRQEFGVLAANKAGLLVVNKRTDVNGVLLGHRQIAGRWWFIYLTGAVSYEGSAQFPVDAANVDDVRLFAVSGNGDGTFTWLVSPPDPEAAARYRARQVEAWQRGNPERGDRTDGPSTFPTPEDRLRLSVAPSEAIVVVDEGSGASWEIPFTGALAGAD